MLSRSMRSSLSSLLVLLLAYRSSPSLSVQGSNFFVCPHPESFPGSIASFPPPTHADSVLGWHSPGPLAPFARRSLRANPPFSSWPRATEFKYDRLPICRAAIFLVVAFPVPKAVGGSEGNDGSSLRSQDEQKGQQRQSGSGVPSAKQAKGASSRKSSALNPLEPPPSADSFPEYEQREYFRYELVHQSAVSGARVGRLHTPHGVVDTPGYVPVATIAAQKAVDHRLMDSLADQQLMFCNTYHLLLQPGPDLVEAAGGLHKFMGRDLTRPLITDSGGFQVFSLAFGSVADDLQSSLNVGNVKGSRSRSHAPTLLKVTEEGVTFRSYRDGQRVTLTPESTVQHQKKLGADIIIPLDELPPYRVSKQRLRESLYLSHRWEARSLREHLKNPKKQAMYAVVHGGVDRELRQESIDYLTSLPFEGFAMGGSFGKLGQELADIVGFMAPQLPRDRPNHLLGIADLASIRRCVVHGVDTFDSAFPSRNGRHGCLLAHDKTINIANRQWAHHHAPVSPYLPYTAAYLHHLFKAKEPLSTILFTQHNLCFMQDFMRKIRQDILNDEI